MPRTLAQLLDAGVSNDELAGFLASDEFYDQVDTTAGKDGAPLRDVRRAFEDMVAAQARLHAAVTAARASGCSWALIGSYLGTSGEAARQRYGGEVRKPTRKAAKKVRPARRTARKTIAKKTTARKTAAKKTTAKRTTARKAAAKKTTPRRSAGKAQPARRSTKKGAAKQPGARLVS